MTVPLAWRRHAPNAVLVLVFVALIAMALAGSALESSYIMLVLLAAFSAVGAYCERRRATAGLGLGLALLATLMVGENLIDSGGEGNPVIGDFIFLGAIVSVVWALAVGYRERSERAGTLERHAERLEREREEQALSLIHI